MQTNTSYNSNKSTPKNTGKKKKNLEQQVHSVTLFIGLFHLRSEQEVHRPVRSNWSVGINLMCLAFVRPVMETLKPLLPGSLCISL